MKLITDTFNISGEANPLQITASLQCEKTEEGWTWSVENILFVELVIGDKEGIDITNRILRNPRALALVTSQVAECEDQIVEALAKKQAA